MNIHAVFVLLHAQSFILFRDTPKFVEELLITIDVDKR